MRMKGKVAIVTGAASGIGKASARLFAGEGAKVVLSDCQTSLGEETTQTIRTDGGEAVFIRADVTVSKDTQEMVQFALDNYGQLDVLLNNAGIELYRPLVETEEEDWDQILAVNVKGIYLCSKHAIPRMAETGGGSIINIASVLGERVMSGDSIYAISKAGVIQMTRALALEFARHEIRVNAISPGFFETDMNREFLASATGRAMAEKIPMRRVGRAEDLDDVLLLLAGGGSRYMTGAVLTVDGGHTLALSA